ncbi:methionyl-tRNA formyltransferase [bacterium]|nr:methionyl-tRNA formyltransferase [bacterium]
MQAKFQKRILFVGMPDMAIICLMKLVAENVNIVACVPPSKADNTYKLFVDYAKNLDLNVIDYEKSLKDEDFIQKLKELNIDLGVVCSYNKLFPKEFLEVAKDGFINVHPSLLPKYRGANPYSHVIINGEKETGVTLHFMDETFDTGDIIVQEKAKIFETDTMGTLFNRLNFLGADILLKVLIKYENGETLPRIKQPQNCDIKAPSIQISSNETFINWNQSAKEINRFIRGLNPFINAVTFYRGNALKIHSSYIEDYDSGFKYGTIVSTDKDLAVSTKKGTLHITVLQAGTYFIGEASEFIRLSNCKRGEFLE